MQYCFDTAPDRIHTLSTKWALEKRGKTPDTIPLWVADMDFPCLPEIADAIRATADHGIYGYITLPDSYYEALIRWEKKHFDWDIRQEWITQTPGVVNAIGFAIRAFTNPGDKILIQRPVYHPFFLTIEAQQREVANSPLVFENGRYEIDFEDFERVVREEQPKLFILCSPHNPIGRVWTREELTRIGEICRKYHVLVFSDEIHQDFVYEGHTHVPFASICPEFADNCITATAPSKTFNLPGLQTSNIIISNPELKAAFEAAKFELHLGGPTLPGAVACEAAYTHGEEWLSQLKTYLKGTIDFIDGWLKANLPQVKLVYPEGTYLLWLDFRALGLSDEALEQLMADCRVWFNAGTRFGPEGSGFQRMNIGCPRSRIEEALHRIKTGVEAL